MKSIIDFTTFLAVDEEHWPELKQVWPGWMKYRPEIRRQPLIIAYDVGINPRHLEEFLGHPDMKCYAWNIDAPNQRAKMLASFILLAPRVAKTEWFLKLDTDCWANSAHPDWCDESLVAGEPKFVASSWGYTKPASAINTLDDWGDTVPFLSNYPRLNLPYDKNSKLVRTPGRIISWCFFGDTVWCSWAASLCQCKPPIFSHDTYLWYVAKRIGASYKTVRMKQFGWSHHRKK